MRGALAGLSIVGVSILVLALTGWFAPAPPAIAQTGPFADWAAIVVAGDWHAHTGEPSPVFDNARRDITHQLEASGFAADHIRQFSVHEAKPGGPTMSDPDDVRDGLADLALHTSGGCLVYLTSHGSPDGVQVGDDVWPPAMLAAMVDDTCARRPTVVIVSACFSGVFVQPLAGPNRMVLTAARPDRASFGCGANDRYTYFDACMLEAWPAAHDFIGLAAAARACVRRRETETGSEPPSEPQLGVGAALRPMLPLYAFAKTP